MFADSSGQRIAGLDTLRIVLAAIVLFGHLGFVWLAPDPESLPFPSNYAVALWNNSFNGPAAVVCFFVISGFCIHFPYRNQDKIDILAYFSRRHIRIWLPIAAAVGLATSVNLRLVVFGDSILWSLIAEEIYYVLYPALRLLARRFSWSVLVIAAYGGSIGIAATNPSALNYPSYGIQGNWILGLPCWLLGCLLSSRIDVLFNSARRVGYGQVWLWRGGMCALAILTSVGRFHAQIGYPWSLTLLSPVIYFWLKREILFYAVHRPMRVLEKLGMMTYSVYLTHMLAHSAWTAWVGPAPAETPMRVAYFAWVALAMTVFYLVVERPSHSLARATGRWVSRWHRSEAALLEPDAA